MEMWVLEGGIFRVTKKAILELTGLLQTQFTSTQLQLLSTLDLGVWHFSSRPRTPIPISISISSF
jgi:hypothetical protein